MEKEIYNYKFMSINKLKNILENFPINVLIDYLEIGSNKNNKKIFLEDIKILTLDKNNNLKFYLKQKFFRNYEPVQIVQV